MEKLCKNPVHLLGGRVICEDHKYFRHMNSVPAEQKPAESQAPASQPAAPASVPPRAESPSAEFLRNKHAFLCTEKAYAFGETSFSSGLWRYNCE